MEPGRELDELVAEKVMREPKPLRELRYWGPSLLGAWEAYNGEWYAQPYSTNIAAAWAVVEKLRFVGFEVELENDGDDWRCVFLDYPKIGKHKDSTVPFAICLAALEAVGVEAGNETK